MKQKIKSFIYNKFCIYIIHPVPRKSVSVILDKHLDDKILATVIIT